MYNKKINDRQENTATIQCDMLNNFYQHDAVRGHYYLWPSVCLFVSATSWFSIKTAGRIGQIFGTEASFDLSYSVL